MWHYREWSVKALVALGRKAEAIRYAEASRGLNDNPIAIARACEEILRSAGLADADSGKVLDGAEVRRRLTARRVTRNRK